MASYDRTVTAAASVLWKYTDPDGKEFYLPSKLPTVKSPYSGKSFSQRPERYTPADVSKELKEDAKAEKTASDPALAWKADGAR